MLILPLPWRLIARPPVGHTQPKLEFILRKGMRSPGPRISSQSLTLSFSKTSLSLKESDNSRWKSSSIFSCSQGSKFPTWFNSTHCIPNDFEKRLQKYGLTSSVTVRCRYLTYFLEFQGGSVPLNYPGEIRASIV